MKQHESMGLVERLLIDLSQILSDCLILSWFELVICQFLGLTDQLYDIFQFHVFVDLLYIGCQGFHFDVIVAADNAQIGGI